MRDGFISVAAGTPKIRVADCRYNAEQISPPIKNRPFSCKSGLRGVE